MVQSREHCYVSSTLHMFIILNLQGRPQPEPLHHFTLILIAIQPSMTIWAGQILSGLGLTVSILIFCWPIIHLGPMANLSFYRKWARSSSDSSTISEKSLSYRRRSKMAIWAVTKSRCHLYSLITHYLHSFSSSKALPLPPSSSLLSPMCFFDLFINE